MPPDRITAAYRAKLATGKAGLLVLIRSLWLARFDPARPLPTLAALGVTVGTLTTRQQAAAAVAARDYLAALTGARDNRHPSVVEPYAIPPGLIGSSASGKPLADMTALAPAVYWSRLSSGQSAELSADASLAWLNRLAASEPYRAANETVTSNAVNDERLTGRMERETGPSACSFCAAIADQGYSAAHAGFAAHANCQCTAVPEL